MITRIDYDTLGSSNHTIPWNLVPLRVARSGNVTVAADPTAGDPAPIAGAISAADQQVRKVWAGRPAAPGTLVFTSRDTRQAHSWLFVPMSAAVESAAFVVPVAGYDDRNQALDDTVGGRMVMVVGTAPPDQVDGMYRHELTHAISAPVVRQGRDTPIWAIEGFAAWVEDPSGSVARSRLAWVRRAVRQGTFTGRLPDNQTFYAQPDITLHYALGLTVFKFVSERWTSEKAVDLYEEVVTGHSLGDATTKVLALDEATFLQQWSTYVRQLPA